MDASLLQTHLSLCVPLEIDHLQQQGGPTEWTIEEAQRRLLQMQEPGGFEAILFRLKRTRVSIVTLTECLAILAFQPGGVRFGELHFDASHRGWTKEKESERAEATTGLVQ